MRLRIAPRLQSTARLKANQAVGTILGTLQTAQLFGDTLTPIQAANAFAEKLITKNKKDGIFRPFYLPTALFTSTLIS